MFLASSASTASSSRRSIESTPRRLDQVGEEPVHDEPARLDRRDAAALEVEQLLVVEPAGRRGVPGALDLAGLDLEVGHRVGLATLGQHEVAVALVRLDALGRLADQDVADPHRVRALALQRAAVVDVAVRTGLVVIDEQPVLDVLTGVDEVEAVHLEAAAGSGVVGGLDHPHDVAAEAGLERSDLGVAADPDRDVAEVDRVVVPELQRGELELGVVADQHGHLGDVPRAPGVLEHDGAAAVRADPDHDVAVHDLLRRRAGEPHDDRLVELGVGGDVEEHRSPAVLDRERGRTVDRLWTAERDRLGGRDLGDLDRRRGVELPLEAVAGRGVLEQAAETLERREPPDLLAPARQVVVGQVVRGRRVEVARDRLDRARHRRAGRTAGSGWLNPPPLPSGARSAG